MTLNGNGINLPKSVTIKFRDKFKSRYIVRREHLLFHIMLKQDLTWFTLASNNHQGAVYDIPDILPEKNGLQSGTILQLSLQMLFVSLPEDTIDIDITVHRLKGIHTFRKD